ncbi:MAG: alpha/beta fold hydrolase [Firmicutes bacterium]|nr:alpha/beta fold hydrolase [Bacillota bacterium]
MMDYIHKNAKSFYFKGNNIGFLLIHGFTGSAAVMRPLGEYLNNKGFTVKGVLLKGHGTNLSELEKTKWKDWIASAEREYINLKQKCKKIILIGVSMGGVIALNLASKLEVDSTICISTPIKIKNKQAKYAPILKFHKKYLKKPKINNKYLSEYCIGYEKTPVSKISDVLRLIRATKWRLKKVKVPILLIQSNNDNTIDKKSIEYIYDKVNSEIRKVVFLEKGGHLATIGEEKDKLYREIYTFIKQIDI